jgi:hypothetical protein
VLKREREIRNTKTKDSKKKKKKKKRKRKTPLLGKAMGKMTSRLKRRRMRPTKTHWAPPSIHPIHRTRVQLTLSQSKCVEK